MTITEKLHTPSGATLSYNPEIAAATTAIIDAKIRGGADLILLDDLYRLFAADTEILKHSVRWGVQYMKFEGRIKKTELRTVYQVS